MPDRTVVTILGARSGTSALAGTLGLIGGTLPRNLMPANSANEKGYFEPQDLADLHDNLLASIGSKWDDWREIPAAWFQTAAAVDYQHQLAEAFRQNYADAPLPVLKEPRMSRLLRLWTGVFEELGTQPAYCFIDRPPFEVAASLQSRDGSPIALGLAYYVRNHLDAEHATRSCRRVFLSYDALMTDWRDAVIRIAGGLGISFPRLESAQAQVDAFLDRGMRHHAGAMPPDGSAAGAMALTVHHAFNRLALDPADPIAFAMLDRVRKDFPRVWSRFTLSYATRLARTAARTLTDCLRGS